MVAVKEMTAEDVAKSANGTVISSRKIGSAREISTRSSFPTIKNSAVRPKICEKIGGPGAFIGKHNPRRWRCGGLLH